VTPAGVIGLFAALRAMLIHFPLSGADPVYPYRIVRRFVQGLAILMVATGCGSVVHWMPLDEGQSWTFHTTAGLRQFVEKVSVGRSVPVAGANGYELTGKMGVRRMAWKGSVLYLSQSPTASFVPALPLFVDGHSLPWKGQVRWGGKTLFGEGALTMTDPTDKASAGTKTSTVRLKLGGHSYRLETVFQPGVGIVDQRQWQDDVLQYRMKLATRL
jgi:hypothetical protein